MKENNVVAQKSYAFAVRIVKCCRYIIEEKKEFVLSKQLLRSGTSIGANIEEAIGGQSERDFYSKICIAYKEARETAYWIRLLRDSSVLEESAAGSLLADIDELLRLMGKITKTLKSKFVISNS